MSKGSEHIDQVFKNKLGQYESPVPQHLFANIQAARDKKRGKGFIPFRWMWMGGVALLLIGGSAVAWNLANNEWTAAEERSHPAASPGTSSQEEFNESSEASATLSLLDASTAPAADGKVDVLTKEVSDETIEGNNQAGSFRQASFAGAQEKETKTISAAKAVDAAAEIMPDELAPMERMPQEDELQERGVGEMPTRDQLQVIPLLPGLQLEAVEAEQASALPPASRCATFKEKLDWRWTWFVEGYAGPEFGVRTLRPRTPEAVEYAQLREDTEEVQTSFSTGIRMAAVTPFGLSVRTGLQYTQLNERFNYQNEDEVREVITNIYNSQGDFIRTDTTYEAGTRIKTTYNRYRLVDLPLTVGYELHYPKFTLALHGGPVINLLFTQKGDFLSEEGVPVTFTNDAPGAVDAFQDQLGLSFTGAIGLHYRINTEVQVILEPHFRYIPQSFTLASYPLDQSYFTTGISAGVRVRL
jgi:hypothetical protein